MNGFVLVSLMGILVPSTLWAATTAAPAPTTFNRQTTVLGKGFGVNYNAAPNTAQSGVNASLNATILGKQRSLVQASVQPNADFTQAALQLFVNGVQVSSTNGAFLQGHWSRSYTIPPINANATLVNVPVGPLVIAVDGGYALSGGVGASLTLGQGPDPTTQPYGVAADLNASIHSSGYIQGSVSLLIIRGGISGQVSLADGSVDTNADLYFGSSPAKFGSTGALSFFSGGISAFADYYGFFSGWHRFWNWTFLKWPGWCFTFNNGVQVNGKCAAN